MFTILNVSLVAYSLCAPLLGRCMCKNYECFISTPESITTNHNVFAAADNKRLDEWLPRTRVEKWRRDIVPPLKSAMAEKLSPLAIPASPVVGTGAADTQRDTPAVKTRYLKRRFDEIHNVPKV